MVSSKIPSVAVKGAECGLKVVKVYADMTFSPVWKAGAQLNLPQTTGDLNASLGTLGNLQNSGIGFSKELNPLQIQSAIITSDVVLERVRSVDPERSLYSRLSDYKGLFEVTPKEQSTIIFLEAKGSHPNLARKRVAILIKVYQQRLNELRRNDVDVHEQFVQEELEKSHNNLIQAQNALAKFKHSTGLIDSDEQTKGLIEAISGLKTRQATVIAEAQANETQTNVAAARLGMTSRQAMNSLRLGENKEYQAIRGKLSQLETALAEARSVHKDESPVVQSLLARRQELNRSLKQQMFKRG